MMMYKPGQVVEGRITGIQPYGAFVSLDKNTSGLIHISEISDGYVRDIGRFVKIGEVVRVKVIDFDARTNQARLSLKAIHRTHSRNRRRPVPLKASLPSMRIGFQSIASHLDGWVKEAEEQLNQGMKKD